MAATNVRTDGQRIATEDFSDTQFFDRMLDRIVDAETVHEWSLILGDHIRWGNSKIADHVATFNLTSAHNCVNRWSDNCQVDGDECYAVGGETWNPNAEPFRERQEYLWDCLDADTWAKAFLMVVDRKVTHGNFSSRADGDLRFNQAGDFRFQGDVYKAERIAEVLSEHDIQTYTYSASDYLDWSEADHITINQSNTRREYGDRVYTAIPLDMTPEDTDRVGDDAVQCPYEYSGGEVKCGDCRLCLDSDGPDVFINLH